MKIFHVPELNTRSARFFIEEIMTRNNEATAFVGAIVSLEPREAVLIFSSALLFLHSIGALSLWLESSSDFQTGRDVLLRAKQGI